MARKVLVADDSPTVQKKASGILVGEGMEVVTVSNGVAAIKKLPTVNPMVILADVAMPGKDGYEVCEFVKASKEFANVPVLLVFSDGDIYDEQRGARVRADGRIKKPFDREELISTVSKHLVAAEAAVAAAAAKPAPSPVAKAAPPSAPVTEPVDEEPVIPEREPVPDFSQFGGGVAFADALEEISATPAEPAPGVEPSSSFIEAEAPILEAPIIEPEVPAAVEHGEMAPEAAAPPVEFSPAEPVLVEEQAVPEHTHEHPHEHPHEPPPVTERTVMFRAPAEIAEPILSDEMAPPPAVEPPPVEPMPAAPAVEASAEAVVEQAAPVEVAPVAVPESTPAPDAETGPHPVAATTLDSYSLSEAAAGQVHVAYQEPQTEQAAPPPPIAEPPVAAVAETPRALDSTQVYSIVYMVVAKMSPRLPAETIEEIAKPIADEITAELNAGHTKSS